MKTAKKSIFIIIITAMIMLSACKLKEMNIDNTTSKGNNAADHEDYDTQYFLLNDEDVKHKEYNFDLHMDGTKEEVKVLFNGDLAISIDDKEFVFAENYGIYFDNANPKEGLPPCLPRIHFFPLQSEKNHLISISINFSGADNTHSEIWFMKYEKDKSVSFIQPPDKPTIISGYNSGLLSVQAEGMPFTEEIPLSNDEIEEINRYQLTQGKTPEELFNGKDKISVSLPQGFSIQDYDQDGYEDLCIISDLKMGLKSFISTIYVYYELNNGIWKPINFYCNGDLPILGLKENFVIELYSDLKNFPSVPAYGPLCVLNASGINNTNALKIIRQENEFLTRVSIEGVIPTWALGDGNLKQIHYIEGKLMYVLNECDVFLTPEVNAKTVFTCDKGQAVNIEGEYSDWYFVTINNRKSSNIYGYGWIKKTCLGLYKDFDSNIGLEVQIKKGSPYKYTDGEVILYIDNSYTWGTIAEENEKEYTLSLPGAYMIIIEKQYIKPFGEE